MAAPRLCPRCGTPVDERRARGLPYCLQCSAPLGSGLGMQAAGAPGPPQKSGSPLLWILLIGGVVGLMRVIGIVAVVVLAAKSTPEDAGATAAARADDGGPNLESNVDAGGGPVAAGSGSAKAKPTSPTGTPTPTFAGTAPTSTVGSKPPFPRSRASTEVDRVIAGAQSCHRTGDPTGTGSIRVDFEPDGRVGTLTRPPFGTTTTGSCISGRMRAINIGQFSGTQTQSIEATFIIRDTGGTPTATTTTPP